MVKIKICGIKREKDIEIINMYTPDYIGFVFAPTKRQVDFNTAKKLKNLLKVDIPVVGVFVNHEISEILDLYRNNIIDIAQLHGDENEEYINKLKEEEPNLKLIKAVLIRENTNLKSYEDLNIDYLLLDNGQGTGKTFNWDLVKEDINKDFFLAGGLNRSNVKLAVEKFNPYAIDLSSSLETDGFKDENKIKEIMELKNGEM